MRVRSLREDSLQVKKRIEVVLILLRYFIKEVLLSTTAVSLVLLVVMLSTRFVKYLANAAAGTLDTSVVFLLILYRIPDFLQLILPLGLFVALLLFYGRLYLDNEMRVLSAAGISRLHILMLTLVPVLLITLIVAIVSLYISPRALAKVESIYHQQDVRSELDSLKPGQFQPFRDNRGVIYTESINNKTIDNKAVDTKTVSAETTDTNTVATDSPDAGTPAVAAPQSSRLRMENVYIFQQEDVLRDGLTQREDVVIAAKTGKQVIDEHGRYLVLEQGYRLKGDRDKNQFEKVEFARYGQKIASHNQADAQLQTDAVPTDVLRQSERRDYQVAWQWRISVALLVPIVALIAVALGKADPRQGVYFKIFPAILTYLFYLIMLSLARDQLIAGKIPLFLGLWWVHGLFLVLGCLLFNSEYWMPVFSSWRSKNSGLAS